MVSKVRKFVPVVIAGALCATAAFAQSEPPPEMGDVSWPIEPTSVASTIAIAGGVMLGLVFSTGIGFFLARKLFSKIKGAV